MKHFLKILLTTAASALTLFLFYHATDQHWAGPALAIPGIALAIRLRPRKKESA